MAKVLVVDDEEGILIFLREFLRDDGHEVWVAEDAEVAFGMLAAEARCSSENQLARMRQRTAFPEYCPRKTHAVRSHTAHQVIADHRH